MFRIMLAVLIAAQIVQAAPVPRVRVPPQVMESADALRRWLAGGGHVAVAAADSWEPGVVAIQRGIEAEDKINSWVKQSLSQASQEVFCVSVARRVNHLPPLKDWELADKILESAGGSALSVVTGIDPKAVDVAVSIVQAQLSKQSILQDPAQILARQNAESCKRMFDQLGI